MSGVKEDERDELDRRRALKIEPQELGAQGRTARSLRHAELHRFLSVNDFDSSCSAQCWFGSKENLLTIADAA